MRRSSRLASIPELCWDDTVNLLSNTNSTDKEIFDHYKYICKYYKNDESKVSKYLFEDNDENISLIFDIDNQTHLKFMSLMCLFIGLPDENVKNFLHEIPEKILSQMCINRVSNSTNVWYRLRTGMYV